MSQTSFEMQCRIVGMLVEGNSIRSIERMTGIHRDTIMRFGVKAGEACARLHDRLVRDVQPHFVEGDEIWTFIKKKQGHLKEGDHADWGDQYTYFASDADRKLIISYLTDKRGEAATSAFMQDLRDRTLNRFQFTADGYAPYVGATEDAFGCDIDFAQVIKDYQSTAPADAPAAHRYSPGRITSMEKIVRQGSPDMDRASTSYAERLNLSVRTHLRRFVRLSLGFSKKLPNLRAAVSLFVSYFNFCRVHETLRVTPAMQCGLTDHIWTIAELLTAAFAEPSDTPPPVRQTPPVPSRPVSAPVVNRPVLRLVQGGMPRSDLAADASA